MASSTPDPSCLECAPAIRERLEPNRALREVTLLQAVAIDDDSETVEAEVGRCHRGFPVGAFGQFAVTLAPAVGRLVARELLDDTVEPALAGCRIDRF